MTRDDWLNRLADEWELISAHAPDTTYIDGLDDDDLEDRDRMMDVCGITEAEVLARHAKRYERPQVQIV